MTKKEKKKYKQDGEEEDSEDLGREIKMSITKLRSPCHFTNEPTQVKLELCSTHRFDDEYISKSPLHKSTQVIACLEIFILKEISNFVRKQLCLVQILEIHK